MVHLILKVPAAVFDHDSDFQSLRETHLDDWIVLSRVD